MPSSVKRSIKMTGQSAMVAIRAITGRFSLSTTARALMDLNVSGASCMAIASRFGQRFERYRIAIRHGHVAEARPGRVRYSPAGAASGPFDTSYSLPPGDDQGAGPFVSLGTTTANLQRHCGHADLQSDDGDY
jgi:hypothetical protein